MAYASLGLGTDVERLSFFSVSYKTPYRVNENLSDRPKSWVLVG